MVTILTIITATSLVVIAIAGIRYEIMTSNIEKAILLAKLCHKDQVRKFNSEPYIEHPMRLFNECCKLKLHYHYKLVALLHDVVEDSAVSIRDLSLLNFPKEVVIAVDCITKRHQEDYRLSYLNRVVSNKIARTIKRLDILDNLRDNKNEKMIKKYQSSLEFIDSYQNK